MNEVKRDAVREGDRLQSLDILRGFDMFWIIGGGTLVIYLSQIERLQWLEPLAAQMYHPEWIGFTFWDLIFPLFMFISGVTIPYAIVSKREKGVRKKLLQYKILKRALILVILGILYNGTLQKSIADVRLASVLGQIGLAYMIGATIALQAKRNIVQLGWLVFITLFITALHLFVPVPGHGAGHFIPEKTMNTWVDQNFLPGRLSPGPYDRLGILCIISASFLVLTGFFAGKMLRSAQISQHKKTLILAGAGVFFTVFALALQPFYPVIKVIWTMTFNFLTVGISLILFALFYYLVDVKKIKDIKGLRIGFFFKIIGLNSITIYMAARIIPFREISRFFTGWLIEPLGSWIMIVGVLILEWLLLYYLYKRKIFLKV
jgi:predicted acyltransferase